MEVTDDAEWAVISARILQVEEARAHTWNVQPGRGLIPSGDKTKRGPRAGKSANPEQDALRSAVRDKLPDAEVKTRLARARDVAEHGASRLEKAQAELRAVLTVRQEAVAVMAGLLPP